MSPEMPDELPKFDSDDEMREWFDSANLSDYTLEQALGIAVAAHLRLSVGDDGTTTGASSAGATGTVGPVKLVHA
ncbi:MAG: hypothetical protein ACRDQZ_10420 [Mycobacteriales bacterium]